ncbi:MAG: hypothetical protein Q8K57_12765 [Thiobacillus sp.]|nr:hypothetical protein [Thiobacillus sp.]
MKTKFIKDQLEKEVADPLGFEADLDELAAFRLLVHAEFEEYLESKAKEGIESIRGAFRAGATTVRANIPVILIATTLGKTLRFTPAFWAKDVEDTITEAFNWIADNNGIKESSFTKLSIFAGKMPDEVDTSLAASLTSYGKSRGDVAHRSVSRVRTISAPSAELTAAEDLLRGLGAYFS